MIYMLDTDICSYIMREQSTSVLQALADKSSSGHSICVSVITYQELKFGAERSKTGKYHLRIASFCERLDLIADWTPAQADVFARIQAGLFDQGKPIGFADAMIAAHALTLNAILVTNNRKHFSQVDGLVLETWN
ncbi:MAG: type II toxin-antitoxin system VapC family toxin [Gammaproteobacteria bacterium]|nr:type II toxin-antitoxin system VapC family toxin [Gammaproteobacteria bacterium]MCY4199693.1 type II toxin-antitoxin system VapC family toxin [Gammaproteobacteria bacterium]MCY4276284.1 type II toxin-antitoxin system VapC family toxin [Gammaproteobacteria bacterium]MCY4322483.1 type II toxin-antitoxin system VapC family toxin [Gammaproteobacteria bacterium]